MIDFLLRTSLRHRAFVLAAAVMLIVLGGWELRDMPVDVLPDVSAPRVTVVTEATGLAPVEVERLITFPIETAVNGVAGTRRVRSASAPGISIVWVEFDWDTTDTIARQRVTERMQAITGTLPPEAAAPILAPPSSVMGEIMFVALTSDTASPLELRRIVERDVRRRLLAVEGVAQVIAIGGFERQYQIVLDPQRLERFELTPVAVTEAIERGSANAPGGYLVQEGQESVVQVFGRAQSVEDLESIRVAERGDVAVQVADVADVRVGPAVRRGTGSYRAEPAVVLSIVKQPVADTLSTTERVDAALDALAPALERQGVAVHRTDLFRQVNFIERAIDNLVDVLRDGAILVALILAIFLWHAGATIISVLAIPLSMLGATLALDALGYGINAMTLGGLAIAVGELVDDAIVDVENVARRLRERAALPPESQAPVLTTVFEASREIRSSIVSATVVIVLVFMPLLFLGGFEGRLLAPLAIAYLLAIGASLVVAVTVTPVLGYYLLPSRRAKPRREPPVVRWVVRAYTPALDRALRHPVALSLGSLVLTAIGVLALVLAGSGFLPELREGSLNVAVVLPPGTSLEQSDALGQLAEEALLADPAVVSTTRRTGRAERDEHVQGPEASELEVTLRDDPRAREALLDDLREALAIVPGAQVTFGQPISHRIDHMLSGQRSALAVRLVGDDLDLLRREARRVRDALADIDGLVDVQVEPIVDIAQTTIEVQGDAAAMHGLSRGEAARTVGLALWGEEVGQIFEEGVTTPVVVRFEDALREDPTRLRDALIPTPSGAAVPISVLADVRTEPAPNYILREGVRRRVLVTANVEGTDPGSAAGEMRARLASLELPEGVTAELTGQSEQQRAAQLRLMLLGLLALIGIALVVGATLRSARRTAIVLVNLPLALAGGVVGVYLAGGVVTIATTIGFITLLGIATRNGILLATRTRDLELEGVPRVEATRRASLERLSPILMTALTASLGLLPLGLALGEPGTEIQAPMALVILCGLATSTALNMIVVPALLARWGGTLTKDVLAPRRS
jgi:CzcA family heavy metal efflux pump